jgi:hypothetical protein
MTSMAGRYGSKVATMIRLSSLSFARKKWMRPEWWAARGSTCAREGSGLWLLHDRPSVQHRAPFIRFCGATAPLPLFMSLIHTCELNHANPFDYLTELQQHAEALKQNTSEWMPWN